MEDVNLVYDCQTGNIAAFEALMKKYERKAIQTAFLVTRRRDLAEDIVQEAFIQCYYQLHSLRQPEFFQTWFYRILVRLSLRMVKREKWKSFFSPSKAGFEIGYSPQFDNKIVIEETYKALYESVNVLGDKLRTVIILFYFNEMTTKEISNVLSISEGTVKSRLHLARKQIKKTLADEGYLSFDSAGTEEQRYVGNTITKNAE